VGLISQLLGEMPQKQNNFPYFSVFLSVIEALPLQDNNLQIADEIILNNGKSIP
jgi:hypothetical protein